MRLACVTAAGARIGVSPSPLPGPAAKVRTRGCLRHGATAAWLIQLERRVPSAAPSDRREGLVQSPSTPLAPTAPARRERRPPLLQPVYRRISPAQGLHQASDQLAESTRGCPRFVSGDGASLLQACDMPVTCLIVDDSTAFLAAARGCSTMRDRRGRRRFGRKLAVACVEETRPDVALVDVDLGEEDGFDVAELLASLPEGGPAVILVSGDARDRFRDRVAASSALGFLAKIDLSAQGIEKLLRARRPDV
jgi:CheY-like chemotaxis protein